MFYALLRGQQAPARQGAPLPSDDLIFQVTLALLVRVPKNSVSGGKLCVNGDELCVGGGELCVGGGGQIY